MAVEQEAKGLVGALMDFSFTEFVTTKIIKFLYGLGILLGALGVLAFLVTATQAGAVALLVALILSPICFALFVMYLRVILEVLVVVFRIAENTAQIARRGQP